MGKRLNIFILILLLEKCTSLHVFRISNEEVIMLVPSIAFRYRSPSTNVTTIAHPSDGWMLYVRGYNIFCTEYL
jgi:hypothetical protein